MSNVYTITEKELEVTYYIQLDCESLYVVYVFLWLYKFGVWKSQLHPCRVMWRCFSATGKQFVLDVYPCH